MRRVPDRITPDVREVHVGRWSLAATGTTTLIFAFEAVVIGGLGSLWGTLVGGIALGVTQVVVGEINQAYAVLAVHLLFLLVLAIRPAGLFPSGQQARVAQVLG